MPVSVAEHRTLECPSCGHSATTLTWLAADVVERPDLRVLLQDLAVYYPRCTACGEGVAREDPLLVLSMADEAPVVLACPDRILFTDDPAASAQGLIGRVDAALREERRALPGPLLVVPFDVVALALARDVDVDAAGVEAAVQSVRERHGDPAAQRHGIFLKDVEGSRRQRRLNAAHEELDHVGSAGELAALLDRFPELLGADARRRPEELVASARAAGDEPAVRAIVAKLDLLDCCKSGRVEEAWTAYADSVAGFYAAVLEPQVKPLFDEFEDLVERDPRRAADVGDRLVAKIAELGMLPMEAEVAVRTAALHWARTDGDRGANLERCRVLLERAIWIIERDLESASREMYVDALLGLGAVMSERQGGDHALNQERATALQRRVLERTTREQNGRVWAMAHTNLGLSLLEREHVAQSDTEDQDQILRRQQSWLNEAIWHFEQALTYRSLERDPFDWAHTQINLGLAYTRLDDGRRRENLHRGVEHYGRALRGFEGHPAHGSQALGNRAGARLDIAMLEDTPAKERTGLLSAAAADARDAIDMVGADSRGIAAGRRWWQLAQVLAAAETLTDELLSVLRRVLVELTPETAPKDCRQAGWRLGELAARAGDWEVAAEAYEQAAVAAANAISGRATRNGRFTEIERSGNVFRWAAYASIRAGNPERALEIVELGRARELALWLQRDGAELRPLLDADQTLAGRFAELRHRIETAQARGDDEQMARASEDLSATLVEIRRLPGLDGFLAPPSVAELAASLRADDIIAYPVTSPHGAAWVLLHAGTSPSVTTVELPSSTSVTVFQALVRLDREAGTADGYLIQQAGAGTQLDEEIEGAASVLGPGLMEPLANALRMRRATSVCIVAIGPLGRVPLHALPWATRNGSRCLLDELSVSYVPSAYVRLGCEGRAANRGGFKRLLAVGNPLPQSNPLPDAEREARLVAEILPADSSVVLLGEAATKETVMQMMPSASHIHLSCHGAASGDTRAFDSAMYFAYDQAVSASEILDLQLTRTRLVVASACQTGVIAGYEANDEALALSTVFLGGGAAGVIASLWSVDDYATCLLMVRFYEAITDMPDDPAEALRIAALWLRDLSPDVEERYAKRHPTLDEQRRRTPGSASEPGDTSRFGRPTYWAGFVFSGA
jgi:CHAT domain-containing protein/tetratricopeptide (TPR) repeat protein